jgi:arylformamidase
MKTKYVDLTQLLNEDITVYPDTSEPKFEKLNTVEISGFAELKVTMVLHSGTHIDAPCHVFKNAKSLDQFPVEKFIGKAIIIPCSGRKNGKRTPTSTTVLCPQRRLQNGLQNSI